MGLPGREGRGYRVAGGVGTWPLSFFPAGSVALRRVSPGPRGGAPSRAARIECAGRVSRRRVAEEAQVPGSGWDRDLTVFTFFSRSASSLEGYRPRALRRGAGAG